MTPEQLTLARQFCEDVGWTVTKAESGYGEREYISEPEINPLSWLFTGNGCMAVKAEMVKRGHRIFSGKDIEEFGAVDVCAKDPATHIADSEPEAVLKAAVAAMKGCAKP